MSTGMKSFDIDDSDNFDARPVPEFEKTRKSEVWQTFAYAAMTLKRCENVDRQNGECLPISASVTRVKAFKA